MKNRLLLLLFALSFNCLSASAQSWLWGQQGIIGLKTTELVGNVATDKSGNIYETGTYLFSAIFGTDTLISTSNGDLFLVKYDQNGNVLWANTSTVDSISYTAGYSVATDDSDNSYVIGFGSDTVFFGPYKLDLPPDGQLFLVKYDANGNVKWAKQEDVLIEPGTQVGAVATDNFGHEYITGDGAFLIKYDRNGNIIWNVPQAVNNYLWPTFGSSVATDGYGNIYVSGGFSGSLTFGNYQLNSFNQGEFIAKFDSSGNVLWAQQSTSNSFNPPDFTNAYGENSVAVNRLGAAYLTGTFQDTIAFGSYTFMDGDTISSNFFVLKYNPDGTIAWGEEAVALKNNNSINGWGSYSICNDDSNHIYISGALALDVGGPSSWFTLANDTVSFNNFPNNIHDVPSFLLKLDSSGNVLCSSTLIAGGLFPNTVTSDATGKFIYLGGTFGLPFAMGNDTLLDNTGVYDTYVGRWEPCNVCNLAVAVTPSSVSICPGQSAVLATMGGTMYTWRPTASLNLSTGDTVIATPSVTTKYTVIGTDSVGCLGFASTVVTVLSPPDTPSITESGNVLTSSATQGNQWMRNDTVLNGATNQTYTASISGWYHVIAENPANGCSSISDSVYLSPTTGVNLLTVESGQVTVYPNPTGGEIIVTISPSAIDVNDWNLQVTDVLDRTVYVKQSLNHNNDIDLSCLPAAMYFIIVTNNRGRTVVPVVKQ